MADKGGYNPYENRNVVKPISDFGAFVSLLKCVVGTGVLALPLAFYFAGIVNGVILLVLICFMLIHGMQMLIICMVETSRRLQVGYATYPETMAYAFGQGPKCFKCMAKAGGYIADIVLCLSQFGVCVVYIIFVSVNIKQLCDYHVKVIDLRIFIVIVGFFMIFPFLLRRLKYLVPFNIAASIFIYTGFAIMMYYLFVDLPPISERNLFFGPIEKLPMFFGIALFSITSVGVMLAVEAQMAHPEHYIGWFGVLDMAIVLVIFSYVFFGVMGYWRYGDEVKGSLSLNIPTDETVSQVSKAFIATAIFLTYPLAGYVVIDIIMTHYWNKDGELKHAVIKELILRVCYVLVSVIVGIVLPDLGPLLSLVGAFTISLLNLVFPAMIEICLYYPPEYDYGKYRWKLVKDIFYIVVGTIILVQGTAFSIKDMLKMWVGEDTTEGPETTETTEALTTAAVADPPPALRFL
ncbi:glutamate transporter polyphemus isoform X2 [Drosophila eugracilis]|uniref:glutamate transporter polyphemus isoform X2 n=1 Tax=Drosophila eugracilis TaxID=29029 RepID=UPI001BDAC4D0|nr:glutamate transporter polyphemus isoform X2 [Drosophila eugracilis]